MKRKAYRVLFVDDDQDLLASVRVGLRKGAFQVVTADSAAAAATVLRDQRIDVVVSDERMPDVEGSRFLGFVRRNFPHTVRIVLTGQATLEGVKRAVNEGGIDRLLSKPCSLIELSAVIEECLLEREKERAGLAAR